jgi:hypothetical protein
MAITFSQVTRRVTRTNHLNSYRRLTADEGTVITEETGADERFGQLTAMRNACHRLTRRTVDLRLVAMPAMPTL